MLTLKEFLDNSMNDSVNRFFAFLLDEVCRGKRNIIEYLTEGKGTLINENIGIAFPESKAFFKGEEGYLESGMELYAVYPSKTEFLDEVNSFFMTPEVAYRYLRLYYNSYLELHPEDKEGLTELEKHGIEEEDPNFEYYNVLWNIYKYVKWYWDPKRWEE